MTHAVLDALTRAEKAEAERDALRAELEAQRDGGDGLRLLAGAVRIQPEGHGGLLLPIGGHLLPEDGRE